MHLRRALATAAIGTVMACTGAVAAVNTHGHAVTLGPNGIGAVHFGLTKSEAVAELRTRFGAPTAQGVNTGCGARFTEVEWGDLAAEFHGNRFAGYRYITGGFRMATHTAPVKRVTPKLATARGVTLNSTLTQLRAAYRVLHLDGVDRWLAGNGLVFVDGSPRFPAPPSSRIIEIKVGTCGDY